MQSVIAALLLAGASPAIAQSERGYPRLMQGPMLGATTPESALVWVRGSGDFDYAIEYDTTPRFESATRTEERRATKGDDYTITFDLRGLKPDTRYYYRVIAEGSLSKYQRGKPASWFETPPADDAAFRVAFGSCARFQKSGVQPIWDAIERSEPDLFFWLGDNIYGDALDPDILAEEYRRQRDIPEIQTVIRSVPQLATWDDHDFGLNNHDRRNPIKAEALTVFRQYWPNPGFGTENAAGVHFAYSYGGVDFFFIDGRYHRDPNAMPDGPGKSMLGTEQFDWLVDGLAASKAPFKVIVSGSGFTSAKGGEGDAWSAFLHERDRLFAEIVEREIDGVVLFSGDTHRGELNRIDSAHAEGYPLFEIVSSPLAQEPNDDWQEIGGRESRVRPVYNLAPNAALVDFDTTEADPVLRVNLVNQYNELVWSKPFVVHASELRVGGSE